MNQNNAIETILDKAIDLLPDEAIIELNEMPEDVDDKDLLELLDKYGVDLKKLADETVSKEGHE